MQNFNIVRKRNFILEKASFRDASVIGKFDLTPETLVQKFSGNFDLPEEWSVGLIVGASGTGKTTIATELYKEEYASNNFLYKPGTSVMDNMPEGKSVSEITTMFASVGFSSPPSWLKPYHVLSNGEKMRVDLARVLLSEEETSIFDEFTSVVDRNVARVTSFATQKAVRKTNKKFIAVGCHYDVEEWLQPDWVFDTNEMKMIYNKRRYLRRPTINIEIFETKEKGKFWDLFKKYHYLNHSHNNCARVFLMTIDGELCGFFSAMHFPHPRTKKIWKGHRLVVFPDYQGMGIGSVLMEFVGDLLLESGKRFTMVTSHPVMMGYARKSKKWSCTRKGRLGKMSKSSDFSRHSESNNRITTSWEYTG